MELAVEPIVMDIPLELPEEVDTMAIPSIKKVVKVGNQATVEEDSLNWVVTEEGTQHQVVVKKANQLVIEEDNQDQVVIVGDSQQQVATVEDSQHQEATGVGNQHQVATVKDNLHPVVIKEDNLVAIEVDNLAVTMEGSHVFTMVDSPDAVEEGSLVELTARDRAVSHLKGITVKEDIEADIVAREGNSFKEDIKAGSHLEVDSRVIMVGIEAVRTLTRHIKAQHRVMAVRSQELTSEQHSSRQGE